jgi:hypothetical protein
MSTEPDPPAEPGASAEPRASAELGSSAEPGASAELGASAEPRASAEPHRAAEPRASGTRRWGFGATVAATLGVLALAAGALVGVNAIVGMRVDVSVPDVSRLVAPAHQTIVLTANEQLQPLGTDDVSLEPEVPFTVTAVANRVTIALDEPLRFGTAYRLEVSGVAGSTDARPRTITRSFVTPEATVVVQRSTPAGTELVAVEVPTGESVSIATPPERVLLERPAVSGFATGGGRVVAAVPAGGSPTTHDELLSIDVATGETSELPMPEGFAAALAVQATEELWGFRFEAPIDATDHSLDDVLHVGRGTGAAEPVLGLDGAPLRVLEWASLPGRPALVARDVAGEVLLVDLRPDRSLVPLGGHPALISAGPDGRSMVVSDDAGLVRHDLVTGAVAPVDFSLDDGRIAYPSDALVSDGLAVLSYSLVDPDSHLFVQRVTAERTGGTEPGEAPNPAGPQVLYDSGDTGSTVTRVSLSPDQRLVAIEVSDAATGRSSSRILELDDAGSGSGSGSGRGGAEGGAGAGARLLAEIDGTGGDWTG